MTETTERTTHPDVRKTVRVDAAPERAFAIFTERPIEWWPEHHVFVSDRRSITIEPRVGGRYFERGADGTEIDWGTVLEWDPPRRIALTWRVGAGWTAITDDEHASVIEVEFSDAGDGRTEVTLTHAQLDRHGEIAGSVYAALQGPSPGETLQRYRDTVTRHVATAPVPVPVTLLNSFTVTGTPEEFEQAFASTARWFADRPGFLGHTLVRSTEDPNRYVNIARWTDAAALRRAVGNEEFRRHAVALRALATSEPAVYAERLTTDPA
jgi:heme-degrading monooxygenase HmoA/uncharacterized protein YndB with AHSA1/START domain